LTNTDNVNGYLSELKELLISEEVPSQLEAQHKLCEYRLNEGLKILSAWNRSLDNILEKANGGEENNDVYQSLIAIQLVENPNTYAMFNDKYKISDDLKDQLLSIKSNIKTFVTPRIVPWIKEQKCITVEYMSQYNKHIKRIIILLKDLGYFTEAAFAEKHGENELQSREDIKDRQELKINCDKFMAEKNVTKFIAYTTLADWEKEGVVLLDSIEKHKNFLGTETVVLRDKVCSRVNEIVTAHQKIKTDMDDIWNDIYDLADIDAVEAMIERIDYVCKKGITITDRDDFVSLQRILEGFIEDIKELSFLKFDRMVFIEKYDSLYKKYSNEELEIDVVHILEAISDKTRNGMDIKEKEWIEIFITGFSKNITRSSVLEWIDKTINLPAYISDEVRKNYLEVKVVADRFLSNANVNDVLHYFKKLNIKERAVCLERIMEINE
jgi:hypothetical protein